MVLFLGPAFAAWFRRYRCPHCGQIQSRARAKDRRQLECRNCGRLFTKEAGERAYEAHRRRIGAD